MYWAFGKDDFYVIGELPDHTAAAALAATTSAAGAVSITTVVLLTANDIDQAVSYTRSIEPRRLAASNGALTRSSHPNPSV